MNRQQQLSGTLILIGALQGIFMIAVMEALVPGYSAHLDTISYLGTVAPTAYMFTATLVFAGLCVASGAIQSRRFFGAYFTALLIIVSIGLMGIGIFSAATGIYHDAFAMITVVSAAIVTLTTYRRFNSPFSYVSAGLGVIMLAGGASMLINGGALGRGGVERLMIYPIIFWLVALGAAMMELEPVIRHGNRLR